MILDALHNFNSYRNAHPLFGVVQDFLAGQALEAIPPGRQELAHGIALISARYLTKEPEETFCECHRRHIDIQIVTRGAEKIGICPRDQCTASAYNEADDYQELAGAMEFITLRAGFFMVFYPQDGHMPQLHPAEGATEVCKLVFKIPV